MYTILLCYAANIQSSQYVATYITKFVTDDTYVHVCTHSLVSHCYNYCCIIRNYSYCL